MRLKLINRNKKEFLSSLSSIKLVLIRNKCYQCKPEVESRTQGSRPRPTPRTQKIRGQGQPFRGQTFSRPRTGISRPRPRTKNTCASDLQKKGLQKIFSGDLQFIGVPRILIGGGLNHKSHKTTSSKFFERGSFCGMKIS